MLWMMSIYQNLIWFQDMVDTTIEDITGLATMVRGNQLISFFKVYETFV